jgi:hypothetical protein
MYSFMRDKYIKKKRLLVILIQNIIHYNSIITKLSLNKKIFELGIEAIWSFHHDKIVVFELYKGRLVFSIFLAQ